MSTPSIFDYLPEEASIIWKVAEAEKALPKNPIKHAIGTVGSGLAGMGVGTLAGYSAGSLLGKAYHGVTGKNISPESMTIPASIAGAGLGLAYQMYKAKELEELRNAAESYHNKPKRSISGQ